jgi:hypothetical protein
MESDQSQAQAQNQSPRVNPLQILVNAAIIAYQRGVFSMQETSIISQSIDFFVETKQAVIPDVVSKTVPTMPTVPKTSNVNMEVIEEEKEEKQEKPVFVSQ